MAFGLGWCWKMHSHMIGSIPYSAVIICDQPHLVIRRLENSTSPLTISRPDSSRYNSLLVPNEWRQVQTPEDFENNFRQTSWSVCVLDITPMCHNRASGKPHHLITQLISATSGYDSKERCTRPTTHVQMQGTDVLGTPRVIYNQNLRGTVMHARATT